MRIKGRIDISEELSEILSDDTRVILFDLDDTLIEIEDSYKYFDGIIQRVFSREGITVPSAEQRDLLWRNNNYKELLSSWGFPDYILFWKIFDEIDFDGRKILIKQGKIRVYKDVLPLLQHLNRHKNIFTAIVSNTTEEIVDFELEEFGLKKFFKFVFGLGNTQELCKPASQGIEFVLSEIRNEINFAIENVIIIGDSETDILAGKNSGIKTVHISRKNVLTDYSADYTIYSLKEMEKIIGIAPDCKIKKN